MKGTCNRPNESPPPACRLKKHVRGCIVRFHGGRNVHKRLINWGEGPVLVICLIIGNSASPEVRCQNEGDKLTVCKQRLVGPDVLIYVNIYANIYWRTITYCFKYSLE